MNTEQGTSNFELKPGKVCQDCEKNYTVDLNIPDELWTEIQPPAPGHLCGSCILARIELVKGFANFELRKP